MTYKSQAVLCTTSTTIILYCKSKKWKSASKRCKQYDVSAVGNIPDQQLVRAKFAVKDDKFGLSNCRGPTANWHRVGFVWILFSEPMHAVTPSCHNTTPPPPPHHYTITTITTTPHHTTPHHTTTKHNHQQIFSFGTLTLYLVLWINQLLASTQ